KAGFIDSSRRGVWTLTEKGLHARALTHEEALRMFKEVQQQFPSKNGDSTPDVGDEDVSAPSEESEVVITDYRQQALQVLQALSPAGFERFCQRLLRESGFQEVTVT